MIGKNCTLIQDEEPVDCCFCRICGFGCCGFLCCVINCFAQGPLPLCVSMYQRRTVMQENNMVGKDECCASTLLGCCMPCSLFQINEYLTNKQFKQMNAEGDYVAPNLSV